MNPARTAAFGLLFVFLFLCGWFQLTAVDVGFHVRTGELVASGRAIPAANTFSHATPEAPWLLHQWAPGLLFYLAYAKAGLTGLIAFKALICSVIFLVAWRAAVERVPGAWSPYVVVTCGALLGRVRFFERPFIFSALLLSILVWARWRYRDRPRALFATVLVLIAIWANTHAGVIYAFLYLGLYAVADAFARPDVRLRVWRSWPWRDAVLMLAGLAAAVVTVALVNPSGPAVLCLPVQYFLDPFWQPLIAEFQAPAGPEALLLKGWLVVALLLLVRVRREFCPWRALPMLVFGVLALRTQRAGLMFAVVAVPTTVQLLSALRWSIRLRAPVALAGLATAWAVLVALFLIPDQRLPFGPGVNPVYHPRELLRFVRDAPPELRLYNDMRYGAPLLMWAYPEVRPFVDGRCEAYTRPFWEAYRELSVHGRGWENALAAYALNAALLYQPADRPVRPLVARLRGAADWRLVAFRDDTMLYVRRTAATEAFVAAHAFDVLDPVSRRLDFGRPEADPAEREARRALRTGGDSGYARSTLARVYMVRGEWGPAIEAYEALLGGGDAGVYLRDLCYCYFGARRWDEVRRVAERMVARGVMADYGHYMLHLLARQTGDGAAARNHIEHALRLAPGSESYRAARAALEPSAGAGVGQE